MRAFFLAGLAVTAFASALPNTPSSLFSRQTSPIDPSAFPTQCQSICLPIVKTLNSCTLSSCICTSTNGNNLEACVGCLVQVDPVATEKAEAQSILNDYNTECEVAGINVPSLALSASGAVATTSFSQTTIGGSTATSIPGIAFNPSSAVAGSFTSTASGSKSSSSSGDANPFAKNAAGKLQSSRIGWVVLGAGLLGVLTVV